MAFWSSWKRGNDPREQYYGGSKEAYEAKQAGFAEGANQGAAVTADGLGRANAAADASARGFGQINSRLNSSAAEQRTEAAQADQGYDQSMGDYRGGRGAILDGAAAMERDAANMKQDYQQTAQAQFNAAKDANQRAALAMGSRGGASGLRAAMSGSINANAAAQQQAQITQAQEMNQLAAAQQQARAQAAGIRAGVGAQDQAAASQYAGRQQNAYGNQANIASQLSGNVAAQADVAQNAGRLGVEAGTAKEGLYVGSANEMEIAQLNTSREAEQQRLQRQSQKWNRVVHPFGILGGAQ